MINQPAAIPHSATILIVDDTPGNLALLSDTLSEAGYRVLVATDGLSALEQVGYLQPDIILLDVVMPGIDGFDTCRKLKNDPATRTIPVIFMTGLSELDDLLQGFDEGAVDYVVKPVRPPEVLARVEAQLRQTRNLQRAEHGLCRSAFAALTFDRSGVITWLTTNAAKLLDDCYPEQIRETDEPCLPKALRHQLSRVSEPRPPASTGTAAEIKIGNGFTGKSLPGLDDGETLLLIQKRSQEWDQDSLKSNFGLTVREAEILMWISKGKTNKEVGLILNTSPRTVNKHLEHIFEKLGVPTRTAAVAKVLQNDSVA